MKHALNKHRLNQLQADLTLFQKFLPALDLKRQQLMAMQKKMQREREQAKAELARMMDSLAQEFPWLSHKNLTLSEIISIQQVNCKTETQLGVKLIKCEPEQDIVFSEFPYRPESANESFPPWMPSLYWALQPVLRQQVRIQIFDKNIVAINSATKKATQKVNLFSEVKIPNAQQEMRKIRLFLADQEKSAVIRAKLAKAKLKQAPTVETLAGETL